MYCNAGWNRLGIPISSVFVVDLNGGATCLTEIHTYMLGVCISLRQLVQPLWRPPSLVVLYSRGRGRLDGVGLSCAARENTSSIGCVFVVVRFVSRRGLAASLFTTTKDAQDIAGARAYVYCQCMP